MEKKRLSAAELAALAMGNPAPEVEPAPTYDPFDKYLNPKQEYIPQRMDSEELADEASSESTLPYIERVVSSLVEKALDRIEKGDDGRGITDVYLSPNGELIIQFSDGERKPIGKVVGRDGITEVVNVNSGSAGSGVSVKNEGEMLGHNLSTLNFIGAGVTATKTGAQVDVEITQSGLGDGDKGDITVSSSGTVWTIDDEAVSYAKMQNVSAASKLLGRGDSGAGDVQEITLGANLTMTGTTLSASGGGGGNAVSAEVNFGAASQEGDVASVTVAAAWVTPTSKIVCAPFAVATALHDPDDYAVECITAYASNIVNGVGFDIIARAPNRTFGTYVIHAIGV